MDLGFVDTREAQFFVWQTMKYEVKSINWLFTMRKFYCEIDIV